MNDPLEVLFTEAQARETQGDWQGAVDLYRAALTLRPEFLEAHHNLAVALRHLGQSEAALISAKAAAELAPDHPTVQFSLGVSLEQMEQTDAAINAYHRSASLRPNYVAALSNLGRLLEVTGRVTESIEILERAFALAPSSTAVRLNLANSYLLGGKPKKSAELLQNLIQEDQDITDIFLSLAQNSLGVAAHVMGERKRAIRHFREAINHAPEFAEAHENLAQALLHEEEYEEAWAEYEWRWRNDSNRQSKRRYEGKIWNGQDIEGQTLLVHAEQGFGDIIQFARFLPTLTGPPNSKVGPVIFACHAALVDLFSGVKGFDSVVDIDGTIPPFDTHVPLLSLPRLLGITENNIPTNPLLAPESPAKEPDSASFKVGLAWAGMPRHAFDPHRNRSCPVESLKPLLDVANIELFSLQTGPNALELSKINESGSIIDLNSQIQSFNDTKELISRLDLIITIDTALAHLAGSMGKNVWILLATCADWRWKRENQENPWYPTSRIFRQIEPGNWDDPLDDVIQALKEAIL